MKITIDDIYLAQKTITFANETPCDYSRSCSQLLGADIFFKLENTQRTGSFKIRGAANKIASLNDEQKLQGVIACSAGNHAQGVALSAKLSGVKAVIVMPDSAPLTKIQATQNYGAEVILHGNSFDEAKDHAIKLAKEKSYVFVHPYEDEKVIAGQGTIGLEIFQQIEGLDQVVVPIGGGGLISGVALALKMLKPSIRIVGVQSQAVDTMYQMFRFKKFVEPMKGLSTIADGISVKVPSQKIYDHFISKYVDDIVHVDEDEIAEAIVYLLERVKTVAEGAGAAALAAVLSKKVSLKSKNCILVSGGNIDLNIVEQVIQRGQVKRGRLIEMSIIVPDVPGSLSQLTKILAENKANVLEVHHDRVKRGLNLKETQIDFVIETTGHEHIGRIRDAIKQWGARLV